MRGNHYLHVIGDLDRGEIGVVYRQMGECLADIHRISESAFGYITTEIIDPEETSRAYMDRQFDHKIRQFIASGGDAALAAAVKSRADEQAGALDHCTSAVLCHNDFHEGNVLVEHSDRGWMVTGFIDVENACAGDPMLDLAKTEYYSIRGDEIKRTALYSGYGPLPTAATERIDLFRLFHALGLVPVHRPGRAPAWNRCRHRANAGVARDRPLAQAAP